MTNVWINGNRTAETEGRAFISAADRGVAYGDGLFATMLVANGRILLFNEHIKRLQQGAQRLGISWQLSEATTAAMQVALNEFRQGCMKLIITRGVGGRGYSPSVDSVATEILSLSDYPCHYRQWQQQGVCLTHSAVTLALQPRLAGIKHLNRLEQVLIKQQALPDWAQDFVVFDHNGAAIETSMANLFIVNGFTCKTPALSQSGVAGVMRKQVMQFMIESGYDIHVSPLTQDDLKQAEHVFITNSLMAVVDVIRIDATDYQRSPVTDSLRTRCNG